ncbi:MAG: GNAT family N-acetyltransferase [Cyclobacteriaceae bacterium]|nr:GNAT family N-acetyltransferase [Cyclobacteriaceae bacterium]
MKKTAVNTLFHYYNLTRKHAFTENLFLFNSARHLFSQSKNNWRVYELVNENSRKVTARISFCLDQHKAQSPLRAPYGGLEIFDKVTPQELTDFVRLIETDLKAQQVRTIYIRSYPEAFSKNAAMLAQVFDELNYKHSKETTSIIPVDGKSFERKIKISERQKLKKAKSIFKFEMVRTKHLREIYTFIALCRKERNQSLSMTFAELNKLCELFSNRFLLVKVYNADGIAAACIAIKVNDQIVYTFYYAHARRFDKLSPVVWMMEGIYDYAKSNEFKFIDLGTSIVNGKVSRSLLHFKKSIGGQPSDKLIAEKLLI